MFNWFKKKEEETPSSDRTAQAVPQSVAPTANETAPRKTGHWEETGRKIDDVLADDMFAGKDKAVVKQNLITLIEKGMAPKVLFSVLAALDTSFAQAPAENPAPSQTQRNISPPVVRQDKKTESEVPVFPPAEFYEYLAWIEDTDQYKRLYFDAQHQEDQDICCFCGGDPGTSPSITLLNRWRVHEKCYSLLAGNLNSLKSILEAKIFFDASPNVMSAFRLINTNWPGTPPDWQVRRQAILARAGNKCEDCGWQDDILEIRHIVPIDGGGNHAPENLIGLCSVCREQYKNDPALGTANESGERKNYCLQKMELVESARTENKDVRFTYRDEKGTISIRTITPKEWEYIDGTRFINGFCYLLNDDGVFDVRRMSNLEIT